MKIVLSTLIVCITVYAIVKLYRHLSTKFWKKLWRDESDSHQELRVAYCDMMRELTELRAFKRRFTTLIESTKRKKNHET